MTDVLNGKTGIILGVANKHSICWGIANVASRAGADLLLGFPNETVGKRVRVLAAELSAQSHQCDVAEDESIDRFFNEVDVFLDGRPLDFVVHGVSFSEKEELDGPYLRTSRQNFRTALDISTYSLTAVCQRVAPRMSDGGSILTLTYLGAERVVPNYNVMGVAKAALEASVRYLAHDLGPQGVTVNAISAGPIKTLAASGISGLRSIIKWNAMNAPLQRNTTIEEVGDAALFCLSDLGRGMTGEVLHIDNGYHTVGVVAPSRREAFEHAMFQGDTG
ncbi:enoyl-ACP reductase [Labrenzia sp. CE80]|uniref:enoyl-ACP reductase FabI n=1 Tax=Labrenzia sp. CE80 TaxID=1788986 RepID=UPI00129BA5DE|nr:enoyl-ACP reductase [Labrenzia sp. CE80]